MIREAHGNLLEARVDALVNTVNCVGIMGKGIALQFKQAFPENFKLYEKACKRNEVQLGKVFMVPTGDLFGKGPKWIVNFPTKNHWKARSRLEDIKAGLEDLVQRIKELGINSIAMPPLGCGNGGLEWSEVEPVIREAMAQVPDVDVHLYAPGSAPKVDEMVVRTEDPGLTRPRALLIKLLALYRELGYRHSLLEVQKLAYFLQEAGEPMRLAYGKQHYGPYAENLHFVLQRLEGHYIRGYGDRNVEAEIALLDGAVEAADAFLAEDPGALDRLRRVQMLIEGFETPYGMELLSTVHWLAVHDRVADSPVQAAAAVQSWSKRKAAIFRAPHVGKAWSRLETEGWIAA